MTEKNPNEIVSGLKQQNFNSTEMCYNNKIFTQRKCGFFLQNLGYLTYLEIL